MCMCCLNNRSKICIVNSSIPIYQSILNEIDLYLLTSNIVKMTSTSRGDTLFAIDIVANFSSSFVKGEPFFLHACLMTESRLSLIHQICIINYLMQEDDSIIH